MVMSIILCYTHPHNATRTVGRLEAVVEADHLQNQALLGGEAEAEVPVLPADVVAPHREGRALFVGCMWGMLERGFSRVGLGWDVTKCTIAPPTHEPLLPSLTHTYLRLDDHQVLQVRALELWGRVHHEARLVGGCHPHAALILDELHHLPVLCRV